MKNLKFIQVNTGTIALITHAVESLSVINFSVVKLSQKFKNRGVRKLGKIEIAVSRNWAKF